MEPSSTRLRAATAWATGDKASPEVAPSLHARAALQFAEKRQYRELLHAVQLRPEVAVATDAFGMTPLHWLCSDRDVSLRALQQLVLAYPTATTTRNLAGLLPLHLAVRKDLALDALKTVLKFHPKAIVVATPDGKTPVELAQDHVTSRATRHFLKKLDQEVRALGRVPSSSATDTKTSTSSSSKDAAAEMRGWEDGYPVAIIDASMSSQPSASQRSLDDRSTDGVGTRPLPPVWKLNTNCYACETKFGYFKKRHHCRNCGESVCGRHSKHSMPLKHLGLFHAQRVCDGCYARLQSHYTSQAIARLSPHSAGGSRSHGEDVMREHLLPRMDSSPRQRPTRSRSAHSMTFACQAQQHPLLSPRDHYMQTPSPLTVTPPHSTRTMRSATMSPRTCRTASTNTMHSGVSNATSTTTTASRTYQPNFIKMPSGMSMHITHLQRTDNQATVLDRQREMQRRRDRLANTDLETYAWQGRDSETSSPRDNQRQEEDKELLMEMQMEKLLLAKKQIRDALQRSKRDADNAQDEKEKYDGLAKEYEQRGYSYSSEGLDKEEANGNGTFLDSDSGADDTGSITSSCAAAKYGYYPCDDNQQDHDGGADSITAHDLSFDSKYDADDDDDSAVYGLVPETTPGDPVRKNSSPQFEKDSLDLPLDLAATYLDLGIALLTKGDFIGAAIELQKSLDIDQQNAQTWYHFAKALDGKGESDEAEIAIQKALAIEPNSLPSLSLLGKLLNARGEHDEAIIVFRRALNLQCPSDSPPTVRAY